MRALLPDGANGSVADSDSVGCWFKSSSGNCSGVAQWQGVRLWPGITGVRFSPPEPTGCSLEARHSVWDRDDVVSITTIPTDSLLASGVLMAVGQIVFWFPPSTASKRAEIGAVAHSGEHSLDKRKAVGAEPTSSTVAVAKWKGGRSWPSQA